MKVLDYDGTDHLIDKIYDVLNSGGSADYIVEEGTHGSWYYRKWASGIAECWCRVTMTATKWSAWGNVWEGSPYPAFTFPSGLFNAIPCVTVNVSLNVSGGVMYEMGQVTQSGIGYVIPIRPVSTSNSLQYQYFVQAKGTWKAFTPSVSRMSPKKGTFTCVIPRLANQNVTFNYTQVAENILVATAEITANTSSDGGRLYLYFEGSPSGLPFTPLKGFGGCECNNVCYSMASASNKNLWIGGLTGTMASGKYMTMRFILIG